MARIKTYRNNKKQSALISKRTGVLLFALVISAAALAYAVTNSSSSPPPSQEVGKTKINYEPATDEEKKATEAHKDDLAQSSATPTTSGGKQSVKPTIVYADSGSQTVEVGAFVPGLYGNGVCTLTATSGSYKVTRQNDAFEDATTTSCKPFSIERSAFSISGTWTINVAYSSSTAAGISENKNIVIK